MSNFKEGDRVVYAGWESPVKTLVGKAGLLLAVRGSAAEVLFDSGVGFYNVLVENLVPELRFVVGQLVRCLEDNQPGEQFTAGEVYEVSEVDNTLGRIDVLEDDSGDDNGWAAQYFEPAVVVGSRVKFRPTHMELAGRTATVRKIVDHKGKGRELIVEIDGDFDGHSGDGSIESNRGRWVWEGGLDLITVEAEPKSREAIVCVLADYDGKPLPAARPYVHPNRESAIKESERLAEKNPGKNFAVYEAVSMAYAVPPPKPLATSIPL